MQQITIFLKNLIALASKPAIIDEYADRHLRDGLPRFPSYVAYVHRLNQVADVFAPLLALIQQE